MKQGEERKAGLNLHVEVMFHFQTGEQASGQLGATMAMELRVCRFLLGVSP